MSSRLQFFAALLLAGVFSDHRIRRMRETLRAMRGERASLNVAQQRNAICASCPIFYRPLATCGSPIRMDFHAATRGCYCHCPTKNQLKSATCWIADATNGQYGWPERLYD